MFKMMVTDKMSQNVCRLAYGRVASARSALVLLFAHPERFGITAVGLAARWSGEDRGNDRAQMMLIPV
jgi:hypothetical protein